MKIIKNFYYENLELYGYLIVNASRYHLYYAKHTCHELCVIKSPCKVAIWVHQQSSIDCSDTERTMYLLKGGRGNC